MGIKYQLPMYQGFQTLPLVGNILVWAERCYDSIVQRGTIAKNLVQPYNPCVFQCVKLSENDFNKDYKHYLHI